MIFWGLVAYVFAFLIVRFWGFYRKYLEKKRILRKIPAPPEKFFGHLYLLTDNPDNIFKRLREHSNRYYPIYRYSAPYVDIVHILDPNDIELVLSSTKHLSKSKIYTFLYNWLGTGLLTSTGTKWHHRRKILTPAFHFTILQQFLTIFNEETVKLVDRLSENRSTIDVIEPITHFTLQSIAETAMGLTTIDENVQKEYKNAIYEIGRIFLKRLSIPWYRINFIYNLTNLAKQEDKIVKILHNFSKNIIKEREQQPVLIKSKKKRLAMLDLLLEAKRNGTDIDYEGIREEVDTFMFEGHDTTSMAISFILLVLANEEKIQNKVFDEIQNVIGLEKTPTFDKLQELKYTERVIKETLRLFPSVPFISRYASEDFYTTSGYFIPEGTVLHIHIFDIHRNAKIFVDPLKFDPDRFLVENINERHPFAYIPFSAGPRNCIGQKFAILELKVAICGILRKFKLEKVDDMYEVEFKPDLVLRPKGSINVKLVKRLEASE